MANPEFSIPASLDSVQLRETIATKYEPLFSMLEHHVKVVHEWVPQSLIFDRSVERMGKTGFQPDLLVAKARADQRYGKIEWSGLLTAFEVSGELISEIVVQNAFYDNPFTLKQQVIVSVSKQFATGLNEDFVTRSRQTHAKFILARRGVGVFQGFSVVVAGPGSTDEPFVSKVRQITFPPYKELGDLFWYDSAGLIPGRYTHDHLPAGTLSEQTIMAFDGNSVDTLMSLMAPGGPLQTVESVDVFASTVSSMVRESGGLPK